MKRTRNSAIRDFDTRTTPLDVAVGDRVKARGLGVREVVNLFIGSEKTSIAGEPVMTLQAESGRRTCYSRRSLMWEKCT